MNDRAKRRVQALLAKHAVSFLDELLFGACTCEGHEHATVGDTHRCAVDGCDCETKPRQRGQ